MVGRFRCDHEKDASKQEKNCSNNCLRTNHGKYACTSPMAM